jgi:hypothetical protein
MVEKGSRKGPMVQLACTESLAVASGDGDTLAAPDDIVAAIPGQRKPGSEIE